MFVVYNSQNIPVIKTKNEETAEYRAYCVGGYYKWEKEEENGK